MHRKHITMLLNTKCYSLRSSIVIFTVYRNIFENIIDKGKWIEYRLWNSLTAFFFTRVKSLRIFKLKIFL